MDFSKYICWLCLVLIWACFVVWEIQIQQWITINPVIVVRYDLMLLPLLVVVSFYVLYITLKK